MDFSISSIAAGFVFGVMGVFFIKRGKDLGHAAGIGTGLALVAFPYFVANPWIAWPLGCALTFAGFKLMPF